MSVWLCMYVLMMNLCSYASHMCVLELGQAEGNVAPLPLRVGHVEPLAQFLHKRPALCECMCACE